MNRIPGKALNLPKWVTHPKPTVYYVGGISNSKGDVIVNLRGNLSKFCSHVAKCKQVLLLWPYLVQRGSNFLGRGSFGLRRRVKLKFAKWSRKCSMWFYT